MHSTSCPRKRSRGVARLPKDKRQIWVEPVIFGRLAALRGPGESHSDVSSALNRPFVFGDTRGRDVRRPVHQQSSQVIYSSISIAYLGIWRRGSPSNYRPSVSDLAQKS